MPSVALQFLEVLCRYKRLFNRNTSLELGNSPHARPPYPPGLPTLQQLLLKILRYHLCKIQPCTTICKIDTTIQPYATICKIHPTICNHMQDRYNHVQDPAAVPRDATMYKINHPSVPCWPKLTWMSSATAQKPPLAWQLATEEKSCYQLR